jgi:hypothetical protein
MRQKNHKHSTFASAMLLHVFQVKVSILDLWILV